MSTVEDSAGRKTSMTADEAETPVDLYDAAINELSHGAFHIWHTLKSHANQGTSKCSPGYRTLQKRTGAKAESIARWIQELVEKQWIEYQDFICSGSNKRVHHRTYRILGGCSEPFFEKLDRIKAQSKGADYPRRKKKQSRKKVFAPKRGAKRFYSKKGSEFAPKKGSEFAPKKGSTSQDSTGPDSCVMSPESTFPTTNQAGSPAVNSAFAALTPLAANAAGPPSSPGEPQVSVDTPAYRESLIEKIQIDNHDSIQAAYSLMRSAPGLPKFTYCDPRTGEESTIDAWRFIAKIWMSRDDSREDMTRDWKQVMIEWIRGQSIPTNK